jgi:hypothetical protein
MLSVFTMISPPPPPLLVCNFPGQQQKLQKHTKPLFYNVCTFIFTLFVPNKLKLYTLCYNSFIHLGIVDFDGRLSCRPSNNPRNHGGAVCYESIMDVANQPTLPPGASSEGVGRYRYTRVLLSLMMRPRKKNGLTTDLF